MKTNITMGKLMTVLVILELNSVAQLFEYLESCYTYKSVLFSEAPEVVKQELTKQKEYKQGEVISLVDKVNEPKYYRFVAACIEACDKSQDLDKVIGNTSTMYSLGVEFQKQITALQVLRAEPPNV
jgi:hypothetical protein